MNTVLIDGIAYDLSALEKDCWIRLLNGTLTYKNPFHNPVVANTNAHGVNQRTVVLRKVDTQKKALFFHTDIRSGKWSDLEIDNNVSWLFYNPTSRVQIRLGGNAVLHQSDAIADEAWAKSNMSSRKIYLGVEGPSSVAEKPVSGLPAAFEAADPTLEESEAGRKNFGLVSTHVHWMEWLWLNSKGHRRAEFNYDSELNFSAHWLVP